MTSPASASFPWSQIPEPPSGAFRRGRLPVSVGGDYLAARGARPGPALLVLGSPDAGYAAIHGLFRLAEVLDAQRLAGSLLVRIGAGGDDGTFAGLLEPASILVALDRLRPGWRESSTAGYLRTGIAEIDRLSEMMGRSSGAPYCYSRASGDTSSPPAVDWMASQQRPVIRVRIAALLDERAAAVEASFQGLINMLRVAGMLEGQIAPTTCREVPVPTLASAPVSGYWTPVARPGQRLRIDDVLGSFRDDQGNDLGNLLTNASGVLLGISEHVHVETGQPLAELASGA